jgi:hypothetical protein
MQALANKMIDKGLQVEIKRFGQYIFKLLVSDHQASIKIEPDTILRGTVFEPN